MPLKYLGNGEAILGFPARDMTDEEILKYARKFLAQSGLYAEVNNAPAAQAPKQKTSKENDK